MAAAASAPDVSVRPVSNANPRDPTVIRTSRLLTLALAVASTAGAQSTGATFGDVIRLSGTPSDIVLDESRGRLYLVNQSANRVDVFDYAAGQISTSIPVGTSPLAAAMSMDGQYLYVSNNGSASLSSINLNTMGVDQTVSLTANPEGVEVGADGRVLITTNGTSTTDTVNSLLIFDRSLQSSQLQPVAFAPPPSTPTTLPRVTAARGTTTFRGKLVRTPDGNYIIGMSTVNNNASTILFVYEVASGSILRSRTVTGQSTVLAIAPDGSRFMAGFTLYDTATLGVIALQNTANIPFPLSSTNTTFSTLANVGGSAFAGDGETLYSAFNVAPNTTPAPRPQASTLLIGSSRNLLVQLGIKIPESIIAKMVITSDGSQAWGLSESGLIHLPLGQLYTYPIIMPASRQVFLAQDPCNQGVAKGTLQISNIGGGKLTFSVPDTTAALVSQASSGVAPATITFQMQVGSTVTRQPGTNLYSGSASNSGAPLAVNLASLNAINIPNTILVYMNSRQNDQRGVIYAVPTMSQAEGLQDILVDEARDRVYITNSGYNRIEVFDRTAQQFLPPISVGQLPHQMALAPGGSTLYVANTGGESIQMVDLDTGMVTGSVAFPAIPRAGNTNPTTPQAISAGVYGLQVIMSDGSQWEVINGTMSLRASNGVTPALINTSTANGPVRMVSDANGRFAIALGGTGIAYLYDAMANAYTVSNRPYTAATIQGYYGPLAAASNGAYFLLNGFILNSSLAAIGGSESPASTTSGALASHRNVAALAPVSPSSFLRLTTPVKQTVASTVSGDARSVLELVDIDHGSDTVIGALAENPALSVFGTSRVNLPPRQLAADSKGNAYAITLSGLTVTPMATVSARPQAQGVTGTMQPGAFVTINGANLASSGTATQIPPPTVLGGSCVTLSGTAIPLLTTATGQIVAQIPSALAAGPYVLQVHSLATGQQSDSTMITVKAR
jgi:DNA-binding beta-propeller fold protein YncE